MDQSGGDKVSGPDQLDHNNQSGIVELTESITSQKVFTQVKFDMKQRAVATHSKVNIGCGSKRIPSLLDSGSQVTLKHQSYFEWKILPHTVPSSWEKAEVHQMFQLRVANNGKLPMSMYVGALITQEPNELLDEHHKTKLPVVFSWNLIKLAHQVFTQNFGQKSYENFDCPTGISLPLFS